MTRTPPRKQSGSTAEEPVPRRGRAAAVARDTGSLGGAAFTRAGFSDPNLVLHWTEIAGPEIARIARPLKFSEGASGGVLTLLAEPGAALFLGHDSRALTERVNTYLGRAAVSRVKFVQGALTPLPVPPRPPKPAPVARTDDPVHKYQGPEGLKNALQSLARWRAPRQER